MAEAAVAVFAKAPIPGYAKTRLIPALGAEGAAALQERLTARAVATAVAAEIGPVTLWGAPDAKHPAFSHLARRYAVDLQPQESGDLGARMLAAFARLQPRALVLIGSDCPSLTVEDLREAARALEVGADIALCPAEDGGYGLIAARRAWPTLFEGMPWGTDRVAELTRERVATAGLSLALLRTIWDVDAPADHERLLREGLLKST